MGIPLEFPFFVVCLLSDSSCNINKFNNLIIKGYFQFLSTLKDGVSLKE